MTAGVSACRYQELRSWTVLRLCANLARRKLFADGRITEGKGTEDRQERADNSGDRSETGGRSFRETTWRAGNIWRLTTNSKTTFTSLIDTGKEKGYLTYGDVNDMLPEEMTSADDLDDLITTIGTQGIDLLDGPKFGADKDFELEEGEDVELDLTPGHAGKDQRPGAHVPARDGHRSAAHARGRSGNRQAH